MSPPESANARVAAGAQDNGSGLTKRKSTTSAVFLKIPASIDLPNLGVTALRVLVGLAMFANNSTGEAYPRVETLAGATGLSDRNVRRGLDDLETARLVEKTNKGGPRRPLLYRLLFPNVDKSVLDKSVNVDGSVLDKNGNVDKNAPEPGQICPSLPYRELDSRELEEEERAPAAALSDLSERASTRKSLDEPQAADDFETWYRLYPLKRSRHDAEKAWRQVERDRPPLAELLQVLEVQAASHDWQKEGGEFVPYPASYLRSHRWADDLAGYRRSAPSSREPSIRRTAGRSPATPIPGAFDPFAPEEQPS